MNAEMAETRKSINLPKKSREKIIYLWKSYLQHFDLESVIVQNMKNEGKSSEDIANELETRKQLINENWPNIKQHY